MKTFRITGYVKRTWKFDISVEAEDENAAHDKLDDMDTDDIFERGGADEFNHDDEDINVHKVSAVEPKTNTESKDES